MTNESDPSLTGEATIAELSMSWMRECEIPPNSAIVPARLSGIHGDRLSDLTLIIDDLEFALGCFKAAANLGVPSVSNLNSRALIIAGVTSYARPFETGTRTRMKPSDFEALPAFDIELHQYVYVLRAKHVSHAVNGYEKCQTVALMVGPAGPEGRFQHDTMKFDEGIGTIRQSMIGMTAAHLMRLVPHIEAVIAALKTEAKTLMAAACEAFKSDLAKSGGKWEWVPMITAAERHNVGKRR